MKSLKSFILFSVLSLSVTQARAIELNFEPDHSVPMVYLNIAIAGGAATDPAGAQGMTELMGELMLRGTLNRSQGAINLALDQMGASLGVDVRSEFMVFRGSVLSRELENYLALVEEILTRPAFSPSELEKLRSKTLSELSASLEDDQGVASKFFQKFLFGSHPYGIPIAGTRKDVAAIKLDAVKRHYEQMVRENRIQVLATGDTKSAPLDAFTQRLAKLRPGGTVPAGIAPPLPLKTRRIVIVDKPGRNQTQIYVGQVGVKLDSPEYDALYLGNQAFGGPGSFASRLMKEIRVERGWSYGASSYYRQGTQPRSWHASLFPATKDTPAAVAHTVSMIEKLSREGITQAEFDFAKQSLVNSSGFTYDTPSKRIELILIEKSFGLPAGFFRGQGDRLSKLSLEQVNAAIKNAFQPDRLLIVVLGTASEIKDPIAAAMKVSASSIEVVPYDKD